MLIRAKAPLRLSFAGGGTDIPPYPEMEGGCVLSATINKYAYGTLLPRADGLVCIESLDYGLSVNYRVDDPLVYDGKLDLVRAAIAKMQEPHSSGFNLFLHSEAPPGSGLGASSSLMVTLVGVLKESRNLPLTDYEIAELAYSIEREDVGISGGLQDQYASTFGGFNFIEFLGKQVIVNPLKLSNDISNELEHNLLLCYTGSTRLSSHIIDDQVERYRTGDKSTFAHLRELKALTVQMKNALLQRRYRDFGQLMHLEWLAKQGLSSKISTPFIDELYQRARNCGALGGKVSGAGGGGYLLLYCDFERKHKVAESMQAAGCVITDFAFESSGLQTWRVNDDQF
jgi:D-glycero-alpha-D-manno-heptose-7-phosphate kinase